MRNAFESVVKGERITETTRTWYSAAVKLPAAAVGASCKRKLCHQFRNVRSNCWALGVRSKHVP